MEDRINLKNKKLQRSSFKITTCERFQKVNNDTLQELCQVRQQNNIKPSVKDPKSQISRRIRNFSSKLALKRVFF